MAVIFRRRIEIPVTLRSSIMMVERSRKKIAVCTIFLFFIQTFAPVWIYAQESDKSAKSANYFTKFTERIFRNWKGYEKNLSPDDMEEIIRNSGSKTFVGDPRMREEQATVIRPIKQIALKVLDGEVGIVKSFLSFKSAEFLRDTLKKASSKASLAKARQVVQLMNPRQLEGLDRALDRLQIPGSIQKFAAKMGPGVNNLLKTETKFAVMGLIGTLIAMGIYDGLDLSTVKDRVLALDPMTTNATVKQGFLPGLLSSAASRHFDAFFAGRFNLFYDRMISSTSFGSRILKSLELKADVIGSKIYKASRMGIVKPKGESLAKQLGLVGVGEGAKFALKDFLRTVSTGVAFGLAANVVIDTVAVGARGYKDSALIGANRNRKSVRPEYNTYLFQRTGDALKDGLNERKFALMDLYDYYKKHPIAEFVHTVTGFTGAYVGSVVAGALMVGGGLPTMIGGVMIASLFGGIGSYLGYWATNKFERSESVRGFRRDLVERRLRKTLEGMEIVDDEGWDKEKIEEIARDRAQDMYKREARGQAYSRMFLVEDFSKVELYQKGDYVYMKNPRHLGEKFDMQAHIRYDLVDLDGDQGHWDLLTNQIFNVGGIQTHNGARVIFLSDQEEISINGDILESKEGSKFRVLSNGLVMAMSDYDQKKWVIKGQNLNTDVFLRDQKLRFSWDQESSVYKRVSEEEDGLIEDPLQDLLQVFLSQEEEEEGSERIYQTIWDMIQASAQTATGTIEDLDHGQEDEYLQTLEGWGADQQALSTFQAMGFEEWKNVLMGKIRRGTTNRQIQFLRSLQTENLKTLKTSLRQEIDNPKLETLWDEFRILVHPQSLSAEFAQ